jgi:hypothetical protein
LQGFFYSTGKDELEKKLEVKLVEIKSPLRAASSPILAFVLEAKKRGVV